MNKPLPGRLKAAFVLRTAALLILLYQIRILAADLADTPVFIASLAFALAVAVFLYRGKIYGKPFRPVQSVIIMAMIPWAARFLIALPRRFFPGVSSAAIILDSLLLNLDRNNFAAMLPFYWAAITSYFSLRSRVFLRADIIAGDTFFLVLFSIAQTASMNANTSAYRWPIFMIGLFTMILFLQICALVFSMPPELKLRRSEIIPAGVSLFLLVFVCAVFFVRPFQEKAVERGGGLLEPKLFRFDFSQVLKLESEISMNDDLVLIVKKDPYDYHNLLRRYTLSGYNSKQGFYRLENIDEAAHQKDLPGRRIKLPVQEIKNYSVVEQEYYIVNFDTSAFIGINMPVEVIPFESWDASSFNSAYGVISYASEAIPYYLLDAVPPDSEAQNLGLSREEYTHYTEYGGDEAIASFAEEIVQGASAYWEKVMIIHDRLKYGEFYYSLKPGIASDGNQLRHFLFNSKKGYCTYFAFAFTLMLRSLGIPCRVAAGFFVDPGTEVFSYYPVRSDMAHAWAEVWFPGYGWIEFDPTTEKIAAGEEYRFSQGTPPELFERLMKEILENRSRLKEKEGEDIVSENKDWAAFKIMSKKLLEETWPFFAAAILVFYILFARSRFLWLYWLRRNPAKKALCLWAHARNRLSLAGLGKPRTEAETEWAKAAGCHIDGIYSLYLDAAAARFAPVFTLEDLEKMAAHYRFFNAEYKRTVPAGRRLLAWLAPPLALIGKKKITGTILLLVILSLVFVSSISSIEGDGEGESEAGGAAAQEEVLESAMAAQRAENWELAVELYSKGARSYPEDIRFPWLLGNLYYDRSLYRLAWDEYRRAEKIASQRFIFSWQEEAISGLLFQLANTAGYLNDNELSASYYERYLAVEPDNREAVGSLAWMYLKLHRLPEGEKLILEAIERLGGDVDFSMTLATIYASLFRYQESKDAYLHTIQEAEAAGDRLYAALAYYNLSILESRFYRFSLAFDCTNSSLEAMTRSTGRIARGELYLARMDLPRALAEYQDAYSMDNSPLSKLSLAQVFQIGGRLSDAALYAADCLKTGDQSWMRIFDNDPVRYKKDVHGILMDSYKGLYESESYFSLFKKISYKFRHAVHLHLFRKYSLLAADAYHVNGVMAADEIHIEALHHYYDAFEGYPGRALAYLKQAGNFEKEIIPASIPSYNFEEGRLLKNKRLMELALGEFDPLWERDKIADVYAELARIGGKAERQDAAERLFAINRGALLRNGIRLPVELSIAAELSGIEGFLKKASRSAALEAAGPEKAGRESRFTLAFTPEREAHVSIELYDKGKGSVVWMQTLPLSTKGKNRAAFIQALKEGIFEAF